jgi:hypothetical protein
MSKNHSTWRYEGVEINVHAVLHRAIKVNGQLQILNDSPLREKYVM